MSRNNYINDTWKVVGTNTFTMDGTPQKMQAFSGSFTVASYNSTTKIMTLSSVIGNLASEGVITVLDATDSVTTDTYEYDTMTMSGTTATINNVKPLSSNFVIAAGADTGTHTKTVTAREGLKVYNDTGLQLALGIGYTFNTGAPAKWSTKTAYILGNEVTAVTPDGITQYECTSAGFSSVVEPTWDTTFTNTTNGIIPIWVKNTDYVIDDIVTAVTFDSVTQYRCTTAGKSNVVDQEPAWDTTFTNTTYSGDISGATIPIWVKNTAYALGDEAADVAHGETVRFICTTAGTSRVVDQEPAWDTTLTNTTESGDISGAAIPIWVTGTGYNLGDEVTDTPKTDGIRYICTVAGTSGGGEPAWDTTLTNTTVDNTVTWTAEAFSSIQWTTEAFSSIQWTAEADAIIEWTAEAVNNKGIFVTSGTDTTLALNPNTDLYALAPSGNVTVIEYK